LDDAMTLAAREIKRLGIDETHRVGAIYAAPDLHAEGANFAATLVPRKDCKNDESWKAATKLKLLIQCDGRISVCPFAKRCTRPCNVSSQS